MKKLRIIAIIAGCLLLVFTITGFFILPTVLASVASKNLGKALHRDVTIGKISVNPYTLMIEVDGMTITEKGRADAFVSFGSLAVNMEWASLFRRAPVIGEVKLDRPRVRIIRFEDNTYNFSDLLKGEKKSEKSQPFSVSNIQITNGVVLMDDRPVHRTHTARDIMIAIPFLSNMPHHTDIFVQPSFKAVINNAPIELKGKSKPFSESLESSLSLDLRKIDIPSYLAYAPVKPRFTLESGLLDLDLTVTFRQFKDNRKPESNTTGLLVFRDLSAADVSGKRILRVPSISVTLGPSQFIKKRVHIQKMEISSPEMTVTRDKRGVLNLAEAVRTTSIGNKPAKPQPSREPSEPFAIIIDTIKLTGGKVSYQDSSGSSPVKISADDLTIMAHDISTDKSGKGNVDVACTINESGKLSLGTSFTLRPLSADVTMAITGFEPSWVQPYVMEKVPVLIRRGSLAAQGRLRLDKAQDQPVKAGFTGDVHVTDFASVDSAKAEDLVSWKELSITGIDFSLNPSRLAIGEISLETPASAFVINQDGSSNFSVIAGQKKKTEKPEPSQKKKALEHISVGKVSVKNGRFTFTDRSVAPKFVNSLGTITGTVTGLSTDEFKKASVSLQAKLDNQAPISITGSVNPLREDLFVDLTASLKNMELSPVTPYSGKYAGYAIDKGKLSLGVKYSINKKRLDAQNDVLIDQLTFGEAIESKDATTLPVRLAVSLLRDSNGRIDLHLPVTGRTDDPDFHVGKVIVQIIVNILEKAATSPFALLEALYPGATELSYIEFEPGKAGLTDEGRKKLSELSKILNERAPLNLEIKGFVDASLDKEGLVKTIFERKLKAQKLKDLIKAGKQASSVDELTIEPAEYSTYLMKAYREEPFKKPSTMLGFPATLKDEEMTRLMLEHIAVTDDDLKGLASERSQQVRDELAGPLSIDASRIFLVEADPFKPDHIEKAPNSRVSLTIK